MKVLIPEKKIDGEDLDKKESEEIIDEEKEVGEQFEADMRAVLGYLNQSEWISNINIGNIM